MQVLEELLTMDNNNEKEKSSPWLQPHYFLHGMVASAVAGLYGGLAVYYKTIYPKFFPFISDLGETTPTSCVFGLFINLSAMFGLPCVYFRHGYLGKGHLIDTYGQRLINNTSVYFGLATMFGMLIVANFPDTKLRNIHLCGSATFFVSLTIYSLMHSYLSLTTYVKLREEFRWLVKWRMALFFFTLLSFLSVAVSYIIARMYPSKHDWYQLCAYSEWTTVSAFLLFLLTFTKEMEHVDYRDSFHIDLEPRVEFQPTLL